MSIVDGKIDPAGTPTHGVSVVALGLRPRTILAQPYRIAYVLGRGDMALNAREVPRPLQFFNFMEVDVNRHNLLHASSSRQAAAVIFDRLLAPPFWQARP
jgi:hypothetical protein